MFKITQDIYEGPETLRRVFKKEQAGASPVAQWLSLCTPLQQPKVHRFRSWAQTQHHLSSHALSASHIKQRKIGNRCQLRAKKVLNANSPYLYPPHGRSVTNSSWMAVLCRAHLEPLIQVTNSYIPSPGPSSHFTHPQGQDLENFLYI